MLRHKRYQNSIIFKIRVPCKREIADKRKSEISKKFRLVFFLKGNQAILKAKIWELENCLRNMTTLLIQLQPKQFPRRFPNRHLGNCVAFKFMSLLLYVFQYSGVGVNVWFSTTKAQPSLINPTLFL